MLTQIYITMWLLKIFEINIFSYNFVYSLSYDYSDQNIYPHKLIYKQQKSMNY